MWILNYLVCLIHNHDFMEIVWKGLLYQYCLRCGKVVAQDMVKENILVGGGERL